MYMLDYFPMPERKRLVVDLTPKEHAVIQRAARRAGMTVSNLIRQSFGLKLQQQGVRKK
jgi:hypothetical protein